MLTGMFARRPAGSAGRMPATSPISPPTLPAPFRSFPPALPAAPGGTGSGTVPPAARRAPRQSPSGSPPSGVLPMDGSRVSGRRAPVSMSTVLPGFSAQRAAWDRTRDVPGAARSTPSTAPVAVSAVCPPVCTTGSGRARSAG